MGVNMVCENGLYFNIKQLGYEELICSNRADLLFENLIAESETFDVVVIDFSGIKNVSNAFFKKYIKLKCQMAQGDNIKSTETFSRNQVLKTYTKRNLVIYEVGLSTYLRKVYDQSVYDFFSLSDMDEVIIAKDIDDIKNFEDVIN